MFKIKNFIIRRLLKWILKSLKGRIAVITVGVDDNGKPFSDVQLFVSRRAATAFAKRVAADPGVKSDFVALQTNNMTYIVQKDGKMVNMEDKV